MDPIRETNEEQATFWNGPAGRAWVAQQALLDRMFAPMERLLVEALPPGAGSRLLDVGCGTGSTTLAFARRLGPQGQCTGIDISAPMIEVARERALKECSLARFVAADAQEYAFEPSSFDRIVSRFGVMFFDDPVRAFTNLRSAASKGAQLQFLVWRGPAENPFMTTAERAAAPLLSQLQPRQVGARGQFAFADPERVVSILQKSGWSGIDLQPVDAICSFPESELRPYVEWLGPVGVLLQSADEATRKRVIESVRAAFEPFVTGTEVRYTAACWLVNAQAS
jgi:ubiquinone/menaquinone biosynthesis C-methylase UbiE